ncbi:MAG: glycoside hydrolase family 97 N-terminal domain-containing protein, partial [Bacteroidales bacterium]|nr:glycoside hydrolase family 97 N-terminal domain-containing protein [Bacteroidales bacterium]
MTRLFLGSAIAAAVLLLFLPACSPSAVSVPSPDGNLVINISEETGQLLLSIDYKGERLIAPSPVGIEFEEGFCGTGIKMKPGRKERITDDYDMPVGKASHIHSVSNQRVVSLTSPDGRKVDICLRAFDDGVAYRYLFPEQEGIDSLRIRSEKMELHPTGDPILKAMYLPGLVCSHESPYTTLRLSEH